MYKENESFDTPPDNSKIWRYMDFTKFIDILDKSKLFFPIVNKLGDPFEGSQPKKNVDARTKVIDKIYSEHKDPFNGIPLGVSRDIFPKAFRDVNKDMRKSIAVSCWNKSEEESAALWQLYCSGGEGIAIQTTIGLLIKSFEKEDVDIYIGKVHYINYLKDIIPPNGYFHPFLYKRRSFNHEQEVRAVIDLNLLDNESNLQKFIRMTGYYVIVNPDLLIEHVFISPQSPKWKKELVKSILVKYGLKKTVYQSDLTKKPLF